MAVPYIFNGVQGGVTIPLSELDANFAYLLATPEFTGNVKVDGTLLVSGTSTFSSAVTINSTAVVSGAASIYGALTLGVSGTSQGSLNLSGSTSGVVTVQGANIAGTWTLTLPTSGGTNGYLLATNGSGSTSWVSPTSFSTELIIGSTPIAGGTTGQVFYDNGGVLGQYASVPVSYGGTGSTSAGVATLNNIAGTAATGFTGSGNFVLSTSPTFTTPVLGTPTSGTLSNCTGLPIATGVSGLGTGVSAALAINTLTTGAITLYNGALGDPASGTLTNCTGLPIATGVSGLGSGVAAALAAGVATTNGIVPYDGPLGTPNSGTLTNCTGLPASALTGTTLSATVTASSLTSFGTSPNINTATATSLAATGAITAASLDTTGAITSASLAVTNAITAASLGTTGAITSTSKTSGVGYATGAGSAVTQLTSRTTGVTINDVCGQITLFTAAGTTAVETFTVTNSSIAATDVVIVTVGSGATNTYNVFVSATAAGSFNISFIAETGTASDTPVINFAVIKSVAA